MTPYRAVDPYDWPALLRLIQTEFAFMDARIDPPSSMHELTTQSIASQAQSGEIWVIGTPPVACIFLTLKPQALYVGKLTVATPQRNKGFARQLIDMAQARARAHGLPTLELQTRVELTENHATFRALGFHEIARTAHPGHDYPTSITFQRPVS